MAMADKSIKKDKNQNIQVFVRLRPLNARERAIRSHGVVEVVNHREVVVRQSHQSTHNKRFTFDRAFEPNAPQVEVYKEVVSPLIAEVLAGYNCTVFAYGQTGTGKTHTMVGESSGEGTTWQNDPLAGIIPRALSQLFDELRMSNTEYNVRVSYLELYNEELCDLLSSSMDTSKLRIYEDVNRKGSTIVNGLEEITVYNKNEVYDIMARGQERKKVASTLMNSQSSRSHTVFTIVVHIKENNQKGEELVKIGKLNLVDLAGSENISKAGSDNPAKKERARECVNINQSLLTLGRVITALVEKHPHIPYRESKLTRILQESLGGRTKTSIIATISPGHKDLEETMSTLEYANRAKNIQNKPEVNQKLTKQAILKEFAEEVDKLKRELSAAREKNGVYLPTESYEEMQIKAEEHRREISELLLKKRAMEEEKERMESIFSELEKAHARAQDDLMATRAMLGDTKQKLAATSEERDEFEHLMTRHAHTESELTAQAHQLLAAADTAAGDVCALHDTVQRRRSVEQANRSAVEAYRAETTDRRRALLSGLDHTTAAYTAARAVLQAHIDDSARDTSMTQELTIQDMKLLAHKLNMFATQINTITEETESNLSATESECDTRLQESANTRQQQLQAALDGLLHTVAACTQRARDTDVVTTVNTATQQWLTGAVGRVSCLQRSHGSFTTRARELEGERDRATISRHQQRVKVLADRRRDIATAIRQMEEDRKEMEERISRELACMETERAEGERRLEEAERRLREHIDAARTSLHASVDRHITELEERRVLHEKSTARALALQRSELEALTQELEEAEARMEEWQTKVKECLHNVDQYDQEFGEGASAISAEMEAFGCSVSQLVAHTADTLIHELEDTEHTIQNEVSSVSAAEAAGVSAYTEAARAAVGGALHHARGALRGVREHTQETTTSVLSTVSSVSERSSRLATSALRVQAAQGAALAEASGAVSAGAEALRQEVAQHADVERRYLMQEYRVYSPSGSTPARKEYRYPRRLAATSPHDRILQRYRHQRPQQRDAERSPDSDCIVVESDEGRNASDSDEVSESSVSGVSEDSGLAAEQQ